MPRSALVLTTALAMALAAAPGAALAAPSAASGSPTKANAARPSASQQHLAEDLGIQLVPKATPGATAKGARPAGANPYTALVPDPTAVDVQGWKQALAARAADRTGQRRATAAPLQVVEAEPAGARGTNDTLGTAQRVVSFGSASGKQPAARLLGHLAPRPDVLQLFSSREDDGAIPLARPLNRLRAGTFVSTSGTVGDGPHGSHGAGTGDFDFYRISGTAGQRLVADVDSGGGPLDSVLVLWAADGTPIAANDDSAEGLDSLLSLPLPSTGTFYLSIGGFPAFAPNDPSDPASGPGAGSEGAYSITFGLDALDLDHYAVDLRPGDTVAASVDGAGAELALYDRARRVVIGSLQDASYIYPANTPLPGGGNAVLAHVAARAGRYSVLVTGGTSGRYAVTLEVYRAGLERNPAGQEQTLFLDFDGARVNTAIYGGPGVRQLSPLSSFLGRWGLKASDKNRLIDTIIATFTENVERDTRAVNPNARLRVLNSRDHADPFGQPGVSRVIVGGTIEQSGIPTIGIAQSIDPGNFATDETALVLLDILSAPRGDEEAGDATLNYYLRPHSAKVRFIGQAIGNVTAHETGHMLGNFHVDAFNEVANVMDQGGNFPVLFGVGPDGVGGTADDVDVDFGEDDLAPNEGFYGVEDTLSTPAFGLTRGLRP